MTERHLKCHLCDFLTERHLVDSWVDSWWFFNKKIYHLDFYLLLTEIHFEHRSWWFCSRKTLKISSWWFWTETLEISSWWFLTRNTLNIILVIFEQKDTLVIFEQEDILLLDIWNIIIVIFEQKDTWNRFFSLLVIGINTLFLPHFYRFSSLLANGINTHFLFNRFFFILG